MIIRVYRIIEGPPLRGELVHELVVSELPDLDELKDEYEGDYVEIELESEEPEGE